MNRGLTPASSHLGSDPFVAAARPRLGAFGEQLFSYPEVSSTNDIASTLAESGAAEGTVVVADAQTAGRGRLGRTWYSPAGAGLYVSIVLRPAPPAVPLLTLATGVAIVEGLEAATGLRAALKWPNDIWVGRRKLGGILAEAGSPVGRVLRPGASDGRPGPSDAFPQHVILGFGINLLPAAYPPDVAGRATSIEGELGRPVERGLVLAECLAALWRRYSELGRDGHAAILRAWREAAAPLMRRPVEWDQAGSVVQGVAEDVDDTGALIVRTSAGPQRIIAGEVRWR